MNEDSESSSMDPDDDTEDEKYQKLIKLLDDDSELKRRLIERPPYNDPLPDRDSQ